MSESIRRLSGKVALVTGAGSGIGRGVVERFLAEGAVVVAFGRTPEPLLELEAAYGSNVIAVPGDATSPTDNQRAVQVAVGRFGKLDVLVANAGRYDNRTRFASMNLEQFSTAFDDLFAVDVKGYALAVRAALEPLLASNGNVIFTASIASEQPGFGGVLYTSAKHAVIGLTRQLALELAPHVRVNAVTLGYVATNLKAADSLGASPSLAQPEDVAQRVPLRRVPTAPDVSGVYALLASEQDGRFMSGSIVSLDSGQSLWGCPVSERT